MVSLPQMHKTLLAEWSKEQRNTSTIDQVLKQIGEALFDQAAVGSLDTNALATIYKDYYEISALVSVLKNDMVAFDDAIPRTATQFLNAQENDLYKMGKSIGSVLSFYEQCPSAAENKYLMVGLNLMFLLASNRLSDFHMMLESVPQNIQSGNPYISTPVRLEQSLMEGAYNKVVLTEKTIPSQFYSIFIRIMMDAVRSDIAASIEKSFKLLSTRDAANMLLFETEAQVNEFAKQRKWKSDRDCFIFETDATHHEKPTLDTARIAKQTIFYAKQLEMIV
ncbi:SAC3/GANP family protein [Ancylostoma duodenale]|uniref:26S proteasome non-ATPase regulatory subunit 8 n=1 Tax=Ancylostoma duodenale TaxID=51022 RepID=A0A0C2DA63_9BILA|nr:SAC3/GANP family protein [Ancylostoma duodenale]